jgi:hypothetical protein
MIRDRTAPGDTTAVPSPPSVHPGVSGDGCVVAYSVPVVNPLAVRLVALNRCSTAPAGTLGAPVLIDTIPNPGTTDGALPAPALSTDGKTIVWSTGATVRRYVDPGTGYALANTIVPPFTIPTPVGTTLVTGPTVDLSSVGTSVAFVAGPGTAPYSPAPANVFLWTAATTGPPAASRPPSSSRPRRPVSSVRARRSHRRSPATAIVTYQSDSTDLAEASSRPLRSSSLPNERDVACSRRRVATGGIDRQDLHRLRHPHRHPLAFHGHCVVVDRRCDSPTGPSVSGSAFGEWRRRGVRQRGRRLVTDPAYATGTGVRAPSSSAPADDNDDDCPHHDGPADHDRTSADNDGPPPRRRRSPPPRSPCSR